MAQKTQKNCDPKNQSSCILLYIQLREKKNPIRALRTNTAYNKLYGSMFVIMVNVCLRREQRM